MSGVGGVRFDQRALGDHVVVEKHEDSSSSAGDESVADRGLPALSGAVDGEQAGVVRPRAAGGDLGSRVGPVQADEDLVVTTKKRLSSEGGDRSREDLGSASGGDDDASEHGSCWKYRVKDGREISEVCGRRTRCMKPLGTKDPRSDERLTYEERI